MSYYLHYFLKLRPKKESSALIFGNALDSGLNSLLINKKNNKDINIEEAKNKFNDIFTKIAISKIEFSKADEDATSLPKDFVLEKSEKPFYPITWHCLKHKGHILIDEYAKQVIPRIEQVFEVQRIISLKNTNGDEFTGIVDLIAKIDGKICIVDNKSSSIKYASSAAEESEQLATYFEALKDEYKLEGAMFLVIPKGLRKKKKPVVEIEFIFGKITEELIQKTFAQYDQVLTGIKSGQFECTRKKEGGCCSKFWGACPYKNYCESNGKDLTGLEYKFRI